MSSTPLGQLGLVKIDKLCDAKFISKIIKTTKTDFALFVKENDDLQSFLSELEKKIYQSNEEYKEMIEEYIASIPEDILKFRNHLKEIKRQEKNRKKELEREAIKAEIRREMIAEEKKKAIAEKMGLKFKSSSNNEASAEIEEKSLLFKKSKPTPKEIVDEMEKVIQNYDTRSASLGEICEFIREIAKKNLLIIKSDSRTFQIRDIDFDDQTEIIKIKVE